MQKVERVLTEGDLEIMVNALYAARNAYGTDRKSCIAVGLDGLADQFQMQVHNVDSLIEWLESAEQVVMVHTE